MSIFAGVLVRCRFYRRFSSAVSYRYPIPRDLISGTAPRSELVSNADRRPEHLLSMVGILIHFRDLDTAAEYARLAYSARYCEWTVATCDAIIGAMCKAKRYRDAVDLFHHFYNELRNIAPLDSPSLTIEALCELGRVDDALLLFRSRLCPGRISYAHLTKVLVYAGRFNEALCLAREYPYPVACRNLIRGFLKLGNVDVANQLLEEFESMDVFWRYDCNNVAGLVRVAFIEHWFENGKDEEAMRCYQSLLCNDKLRVFGDTGNEILRLLLRYGKKTEAWVLFHRMLDGSSQWMSREFNIEMSIEVDSEAVDIMVGECFEQGRFREGIATLYKVKAKARSLKPLDYRNVITRCCEKGMLSEAERLFAEFSKDDFDASSVMMDAYVKAGRVDDALRMANNMVDGYLSRLAQLIQY